MPNGEGHWTLGIQVNRTVGEKTYTSLRLYVPKKDKKQLLERLRAEGGEDAKLHFDARFHGKSITLTPTQSQSQKPISPCTLAERADQIMSVIAELGGTTTWSSVREKLGLPPNSMPGPFLVKALRERGLQTRKNPMTSTMTWQLIDRTKLNGWTQQQP